MDGWCATAPLRLQRSQTGADGRCRLPLLHTAGGLVGGDGLTITADLAAGSRALLTSVAAQKVYGSRGRSRLQPEGRWAQLALEVQLGPGADLEWLPQETVVFAGGLLDQVQRLQLAADASWLGIDVVRLGRTARGETLGSGCWRNRLELRRGERLQLVERLQLDGDSLEDEHGLAPLTAEVLQPLVDEARRGVANLQGQEALGALEQGLIARYRGPSSQEARRWFRHLGAQTRRLRGLAAPEPLREWPMQEEDP
jgi:urease accessory protein